VVDDALGDIVDATRLGDSDGLELSEDEIELDSDEVTLELVSSELNNVLEAIVDDNVEGGLETGEKAVVDGPTEGVDLAIGAMLLEIKDSGEIKNELELDDRVETATRKLVIEELGELELELEELELEELEEVGEIGELELVDNVDEIAPNDNAEGLEDKVEEIGDTSELGELKLEKLGGLELKLELDEVDKGVDDVAANNSVDELELDELELKLEELELELDELDSKEEVAPNDNVGDGGGDEELEKLDELVKADGIVDDELVVVEDIDSVGEEVVLVDI
jgi:hypothetical protein